MTCDTRAEEKRPKGRALISLAKLNAPFSLGKKTRAKQKVAGKLATEMST